MPPADQALRILMLEDAETDAELILREISQGGWRVQTRRVDTRDGFVNGLKEFAPDIILSDYALPSFDGLQALAVARDLAPDTPFIVITGSISEQTAVECMKAGAADYILKDQLARLRPAVRSSLEMRHAREARRKAEEQLRERNEQLKLLMDSTAEGIYAADTAGRCTLCNRTAVRLLGYRDETELVGRFIHDLIHHTRPDGSPLLASECPIFGAFRTGKEVHVEDLFWRADRTSFPVECWAYPVRHGGSIVGAVVTFVDISARLRAAQALRQSEERYRSLVTAIDQMVWVTDGHGTPIEEIPGWRAYTGQRLEDVRGGEWISSMHPEDRGRILAVWTNALATKHPFEYSCRVRAVDGSYGHFIIRGVPVLNPDAGVREWVGTCTNITEHKKAEASLLESQEQLRQAQKMEAIGRLAGGVAHDFNNLLTVINGYSDVMLAQLKAADPLRQSVQEIRHAGERAASLTRQLLAFSRKQMLTPKILNLNDVLRNLERMLRRLIGEDVELVTRFDSNLSSVRADPGQIEQVLMNLAVNSRDAMPKGGKLVLETSTLSLDDAFVRTHPGSAPGPVVMLSVADTGTGMDKHVLARIFEPFFTTKEPGKGTGLGLATVYGIIKQSGGYIGVESEVGRGTVFRIYLPAVEGAPSPPSDALPPRAVEGSQTVLLVEDESPLRKLVQQILQSRGYRVLAASEPGEALLLAERHAGTIDLLLTDVVMPHMNGRELAERLTAQHRDMKVLYVSGYPDDTVMLQGLVRPGMAFLCKPFTAEALLGKIRAMLKPVS
ncbi:MAG: response regulator [Planctomycetes bacterium]|nr:response regulator [Planctomycetota bacterium]